LAQRVPARLTAREGRRFAYPVGAAFLVLAALSAWRGHHVPPRVFGALGGALLLAGLVMPRRLGPVYRTWMGFGHAMSRITSPIVLGIVYFLILTPSGLLMRALRRNPLRHRERDGGFWTPATGRSNLDTQF
jgi:hypothetical protein